HAFIAHNTSTQPTDRRTVRQSGKQIKTILAVSERAEGQEILRHVMALSSEYSYSDMAVLYRSNSQSRAVEDTCVKGSVPYKMVGGMKIYSRREIKYLMSYLKVIQNTNNGISFKGIINTPKRGIGQKTVEKLLNYGSINELSMYDAIKEADFIGIPKGSILTLMKLEDMIENLREKSKYLSVTELVDEVLEDTGYIS